MAGFQTRYSAHYVDVSQALWYAYGRKDAEPARYARIDPMAFGQAWAEAKHDPDTRWLPTIQDAFDHYVLTGTIRRPLGRGPSPCTKAADGERS